MDKDFAEIYSQQQKYNQVIRRQVEPGEDTDAPEYATRWLQRYLLGLIEETGETLREMRWQPHRPGGSRSGDSGNIAGELADMTKYILSMWELLGFGPREILYQVGRKGNFLDRMLHLEMAAPYPTQSVLVTDLDGTLADWLGAFEEHTGLRSDRSTIATEIGLRMPYAVYQSQKLAWERAGSYASLPVIPGASEVLEKFSRYGIFVAACTARPYTQIKRVMPDTLEWLDRNQLYVQRLMFGDTMRLAYASRMVSEGHRVYFLEDNPEMIERASLLGPVFGLIYPYNSFLVGRQNVHLYETYTDFLNNWTGAMQRALQEWAMGEVTDGGV